MDAVERADIWKKNRSKRSSGKYALNSTKAYREQEKHHFNSSGKYSSNLEKKKMSLICGQMFQVFSFGYMLQM